MAEQHQLDKSDWEAEVAHLRKRLKEEKANAKQAEDRAKATAQQLQQLKLQCVDGVVVAVLDLGGARERGEICGCILALTYSFPLSGECRLAVRRRKCLRWRTLRRWLSAISRLPR